MSALLSARGLAAAGKGLAKSLALSALVGLVTFGAWQIDPAAGSACAFVCSFFLMARTYRREWRLVWLTCLLPPLGALAGYLAQLASFEAAPDEVLLVPAIVIGLLLGWWRGASHRVFRRKEEVYAQRTIAFLVVWALGFGVSQAFGLARAADMLAIGLLGGAFSTAMLAMVSVLLLRSYRKVKREIPIRGLARGLAGVVLLVATVLVAMRPDSAGAQFRRLIDDLIRPGDLPAGFTEVSSSGGARAGQRVFRHSSGAEVRVSYSRWNDDVERFRMSEEYKYSTWAAIGSQYRAQKVDVGRGANLFHGPLPRFNAAQPTPPREPTFWGLYLGSDEWELGVVVYEGGMPPEQARQVALQAGRAVWRNFKAHRPFGVHWPPGDDDHDHDDDSLPGKANTAAAAAAIILILTNMGVTITNEVIRAVESAVGHGGEASPPRGPAPEPPRPPAPPRLINPEDDKPLVVHDGSYEDGEPGQVWSPWAGWVDPEVAAQHVRERAAELRKRKAEIQAHLSETERLSAARAEAAARRAAEAAAQRAAEEARAEEAAELMRRGRGLVARVDDPERAQNIQALLDRYGDDPDALRRAVAAIRKQTFEAEQQRTIGASETAQAEAQDYADGEWWASHYQTAAKAGIAVLSGSPLAAAAATGAMGGAEAASESYQRGDSFTAAAANVTAGTVLGAAEGAATVGAGATKWTARAASVVTQGLTAAGDHLRRRAGDRAAAGQSLTGRDVVQAVTHGSISFIGGFVGQGINAGLGNSAAGRTADLLTAQFEGGGHSLVEGGTFRDGAWQATTHFVTAQATAGALGRAATHATDYTPPSDGSGDAPHSFDGPDQRPRATEAAESTGVRPPPDADSAGGAGGGAPLGGKRGATAPDSPTRPAALDGAGEPPPGVRVSEWAGRREGRMLPPDEPGVPRPDSGHIGSGMARVPRPDDVAHRPDAADTGHTPEPTTRTGDAGTNQRDTRADSAHTGEPKPRTGDAGSTQRDTPADGAHAGTPTEPYPIAGAGEPPGGARREGRMLPPDEPGVPRPDSGHIGSGKARVARPDDVAHRPDAADSGHLPEPKPRTGDAGSAQRDTPADTGHLPEPKPRTGDAGTAQRDTPADGAHAGTPRPEDAPPRDTPADTGHLPEPKPRTGDAGTAQRDTPADGAHAGTPRPEDAPPPPDGGKPPRDLDNLLRDLEDDVGPADVRPIDPLDPSHQGKWEGDATGPDQGRGTSAEEARRPEVWIRDGKVVPGGANPEDTIAPGESLIRVDGLSGDVRTVHHDGIPWDRRKGIDSRIRAENQALIDEILVKGRATRQAAGAAHEAERLAAGGEPKLPPDSGAAQPAQPDASDAQPARPATTEAPQPRPASDAQQPKPASDAQQPKPDPETQPGRSDGAESQPTRPASDAQPPRPASEAQPPKPDASETLRPRPDSEAQRPRPDSEAQRPRPDSEAQRPRPDSEAQRPRPDSEAQRPRPDTDERPTRSDSGGGEPARTDAAETPPPPDPVAAARRDLERVRSELATAEEKLRRAEQAHRDDPEDIPLYGERADAQGAKIQAERTELEAIMQVMDAEEAHGARPPGDPGDDLGAPGGPHRLGDPDGGGVYQLDADAATDLLSRHATGNWRPGFVPQTRAADCPVAVLARETGLDYEDVFRNLKPYLRQIRDDDGTLRYGGLPVDRLPDALQHFGLRGDRVADVFAAEGDGGVLNRMENNGKMIAGIRHIDPETGRPVGHMIVFDGIARRTAPGQPEVTVLLGYDPTRGDIEISINDVSGLLVDAYFVE